MDGSPKGAVLAVLGVLASAPSAAAPQPSAQASDEAHVEAARKAFKKGQEAMKVERWAAAEEQFRLACTLAPEKPKPHYYLARALAELGRWDDSMVEVERYLKLAPPNHEDASDALALRVRCEKERARTGVRLIVETTPPGAEVVLDDATGAPLGVTPLSTTVAVPGAHTVFLRRIGYLLESRSVVLVPGEVLRVVLDLRAVPTIERRSEPEGGRHGSSGAAEASPVKTGPGALATGEGAEGPERKGAAPRESGTIDGAETSLESATEPPPSAAGRDSARRGVRAAGIALMVIGLVGGAAAVGVGATLNQSSDRRDHADFLVSAGGAGYAGSPYYPLMVGGGIAGEAVGLIGALMAGMAVPRALSSGPRISLAPLSGPCTAGLVVSTSFP